MSTYIFTIPWEYCVSKRDKIMKRRDGSIALTDRYRDAKENAHVWALAQAREKGWQPIPKALAVGVEFVVYFPSGRQKDPANYTESLLDSLEGVAYEDDRQVIEMCVKLAGFDAKNPHISIRVWELSRAMPVPPSRQAKRRRSSRES